MKLPWFRLIDKSDEGSLLKSDNDLRTVVENDPTITVTRTDRRSWWALAFTGFGAFIVRHLRIIRECARKNFF